MFQTNTPIARLCPCFQWIKVFYLSTHQNMLVKVYLPFRISQNFPKLKENNFTIHLQPLMNLSSEESIKNVEKYALGKVFLIFKLEILNLTI